MYTFQLSHGFIPETPEWSGAAAKLPNHPAFGCVLESVSGEKLSDILSIEKNIPSSLTTIIILGTGGSSLGAKTLLSLPNKTPKRRVEVWETIDPDSFSTLLEKIIPEKTGVIAISKSGETLETIAQFQETLTFWKTSGASINDHFWVLTQDPASTLGQLAQEHSLPIIPHDPGIGGRFSVLSKVGLLPALLAGYDIQALRQGARSVLESVLQDPPKSQPVLGAAALKSLLEDGYDITVMMPYMDALESFGMWFRQLWAESLGKGGLGLTPIRAMGPVDQHSQMQLYLDGPRDKTVTILAHKNPVGSLGKLLHAHTQATFETFKNQGVPVRLIEIETLDEFTLGSLLMHFMIETVVMADLMGVNAYDQPAVEAGKRRAIELMTGASS